MEHLSPIVIPVEQVGITGINYGLIQRGSEGVCPLHNLYGMTADSDVRYFVPVFACANKELARTFHLHALQDVNGLFWPRYSVSHHPSRRASRGRSSSRVFAVGVDRS